MLAFVFPGQGSQFTGMGQDLYENFSVAREVFELANDALSFDLSGLCFQGPEDQLRLTTNTQPAILTHSIAALRVWQQEVGILPDFVAGHSLGEYSALVCSGGLDFPTAVRTVRQRGRFMQEAVPAGQGAMAALMGLDGEVVEKVCQEVASGEVVAAANFNCPGQVVIAGSADAVARAIEGAKDYGAKRALPLPVSAPFHCALMKPAADKLADILAKVEVGSLAVPVVSNVEAVAYQDQERIVPLLIEQVTAPVRWDSSVQFMNEKGVTRYVEFGPGKVLSGMIKRMTKGCQIENLASSGDLTKLS